MYALIKGNGRLGVVIEAYALRAIIIGTRPAKRAFLLLTPKMRRSCIFKVENMKAAVQLRKFCEATP